MSYGWAFVLIGFTSVLWPGIQYLRWCKFDESNGSVEQWMMERSFEELVFIRSCTLGGIGLVFTGFALVARS